MNEIFCKILNPDYNKLSMLNVLYVGTINYKVKGYNTFKIVCAKKMKYYTIR